MLIGPIHNLSKQHKHHKSDSNPKQTIRPKKTLNKQKRGIEKEKKQYSFGYFGGDKEVF